MSSLNNVSVPSSLVLVICELVFCRDGFILIILCLMMKSLFC
jgi:hypothetical protein